MSIGFFIGGRGTSSIGVSGIVVDVVIIIIIIIGILVGPKTGRLIRIQSTF
jgi:hypothetical protein